MKFVSHLFHLLKNLPFDEQSIVKYFSLNCQNIVKNTHHNIPGETFKLFVFFQPTVETHQSKSFDLTSWNLRKFGMLYSSLQLEMPEKNENINTSEIYVHMKNMP